MFLNLPSLQQTQLVSMMEAPDMDMISIPIQPLVSLLAGLLILIMPRLLNYVVAVYLIVIGILGLLR
jgi:hypothetical protein